MSGSSSNDLDASTARSDPLGSDQPQARSGSGSRGGARKPELRPAAANTRPAVGSVRGALTLSHRMAGAEGRTHRKVFLDAAPEVTYFVTADREFSKPAPLRGVFTPRGTLSS